VLDRNQAVQLHGWTNAKPRDGSPPPDGTVLLSPIGGPPGDPWGRPVALIVLFRRDQDAAFSAYDLALVRNVALRIALARSTTVMASIGGVITALRSQQDWPLLRRPSGLAVVAMKRHDVYIPDDVAMAAERIGPALRDLASLTDSHSATLRIALPMVDSGQGHGLALVRVASSTAEPWLEDRFVQAESDIGLNWKCLRTGEPVYERDVRTVADFDRVRPGTLSELSSPIRVEGTVVGTLNLESPLLSAYSSLRPLIAAFCGAVGRSLADARGILEQDLLDGAAKALNHKHTLEGSLKSLKGRLDQLSAEPVINELRKTADGMLGELAGMRRLDVEDEDCGNTLPEILESAAESVGYTGDLPSPMSRDPLLPVLLSTEFSQTQARRLFVSLANILSNLMEHTAIRYDASAAPVCDGALRALEYHRVTLGGSHCLALKITNYSDEQLDPTRIANLYRCPIAADGKLRVGGFLAGLHARRAGARVHSAVHLDGRHVITWLVVPVEGPVEGTVDD
jgi:hypothetical protein